ncbi:hypothetical protein OESDEN_17691 [Oesophagostomum dentatum]|uniref:Uncharacterized protein n=1 Tax=Oesophagostomum dentatum TaxID=61180 RepID=A0A0B1SHG1_OESDE|nr:hypothetical protein OESDEN_17691 [Oesophagostomum dentatum]
MRELSGRKDLEKFKRSEIDTSTIKYANPALERKRTEIMAEKHEKKLKAKKEKLAKKLPKKGKDGKVPKKSGVQNKKDKDKKPLKRKLEQNGAEENDDFENDVKLLKKMKKGRLSKKELRDVM